MASIRVAGTGDLQPGEGKIVDAGGRELALFNVGGAYHALDNTCCHRGGPLGDGELRDGVVACPWHGWEFEVATGACRAPDPSARVQGYPVRVDGGDVLVELDG
jgi:nitrite reductase/ring-hydroxylating ferredoxin subunit